MPPLPCDVTAGLCTVVSLVILTAVCCVQNVLSAKCYKDEAIGDRDGNVYYCDSSDLPRCCIENAEPTCCVSEDDKNLKEQLQLWGMVGAMILFVITLCVCCKNDISFCNSETSLKERWLNLRNSPDKKEGELVSDDQLGTPKTSGYYDNPFMSNFQQGSQAEPYRFPPPPPKDTPAQDPYI